MSLILLACCVSVKASPYVLVLVSSLKAGTGKRKQSERDVFVCFFNSIGMWLPETWLDG